VKKFEEENPRKACLHCPTCDPWAVGATAVLVLVGFAFGLTRYIPLFEKWRSEKALIVVVPSVVAGGAGWAAVRLQGEENPENLPVKVGIEGGKTLALGRLDSQGTCLLAFPASEIEPGPVRLAVQAGSLRASLRIRAQAGSQAQLWVARRRRAETTFVQALLSLKSFQDGNVRRSAPVWFSLKDPRGTVLTAQSYKTDLLGAAVFRLELTGVPAGTYTLEAHFPGGRLFAPLRIGEKTGRAQAPEAAAASSAPSLQEGPLLLELPRRNAQAGEALTVEIRASGGTESRFADCPFVLETLCGGITAAAQLGKLSGGKCRQTVLLPTWWSGPCVLRIWPIAPSAGQCVTEAVVEVRRPASKLLEALEVKADSIVLRNSSHASSLKVYPLWANAPIVYRFTSPAPSGGRRLAGLSVAEDPLHKAAPKLARFWTGFFVFLLTLPLLRSVAVLARGIPFAFSLYATAALLLYLATLFSHRLFAPGVLAASLFWLYRVSPEALRALSPRGRLVLRWAVVFLALGPYLPLQNQPAPTVGHAQLRTPKALKAPALLSARSSPGCRTDLPPGATVTLPRAQESDRCMLYISDGTGKTEIRNLTLPPALQVDFLPERPLLRLSESDVVSCEIVCTNRGPKPWAGRLRVEAAGAVEISPANPLPLVLQTGAEKRIQLVLRGGNAGEGRIRIKWQGDTSGAREVRVKVLPAGLLRKQFWKGLCRAGGSTDHYELVLPPESLYGGADLSVIVYPGPLSQFTAVLEGMEDSALSAAERQLLRAHAACTALRYGIKTGQALEEESYFCAALASALARVLATAKPDGGFTPYPGADRIRFTASLLLLLEDLEVLGQSSTSIRLKAKNFLKTHLRADGSFRRTDLHVEPEREDFFRTALVCCALGESTPALTKAWLRRELARQSDPTVWAACLAGAIEAGCARPEDRNKAVSVLSGFTGDLSSEEAAFTAYALARAGAPPEVAHRALAALSLLQKQDCGFSSVPATQLYLRSVLLCCRAGPRLTENVFKFLVNGHPQGTLVFDRTMPDRPTRLNLTGSLHMKKNMLAVIATGSAYTPYKVAFSYAVPWDKGCDGPDRYVSVRLVPPAARMSLGERFPLTLRVELKNCVLERPQRFVLHLPPLLRLLSIPPPLVELDSKERETAVCRLLLTELREEGTHTFQVWVEAFRAGKALLRPPEAVDLPGGVRLCVPAPPVLEIR